MHIDVVQLLSSELEIFNSTLLLSKLKQRWKTVIHDICSYDIKENLNY